MTIDRDGWFDRAVRDPGPADRGAYLARGGPSDMDTLTHHGMVGWFRPVSENDGGYNVMRDPARYPTAWHLTCVITPTSFKGTTYPPGTIFQHYPLQVRLVHGHAANSRGPGIELEGINEPIPPECIRSYLRLHRDLRAFTGKPFLRVPGSGRGLIEHGEVGPTGCPAGRYARLWTALGTSEEEDMPDPRVDLIVKFLTGQDDPNKIDVLNDWERRDSGLIAGYLEVVRRLGALEVSVNQINNLAHGNARLMRAIQAELAGVSAKGAPQNMADIARELRELAAEFEKAGGS